MAAGCCKGILVILNIVFLLFGLGFLAGGAFIQVGQNAYKEQLEKLQDEIPDIASQVGIVADEDKNKNASLNFADILDPIKIALFVLGAFMVLTAILGMCGSCCVSKTKFLLILYVIMVGVLLIVQLAITIYLYTSPRFENGVKKELKDVIRKKYKGIDDFSAASLSLNYIMLQYECCGVDDYRDFSRAEEWVQMRTLNIEGSVDNHTMATPLACCATTGKFPKIEIKNVTCVIEPTKSNSNYKKGCWDELQAEVNANRSWLYGIFAAIIIFEAVCVVLAIVILCLTKKEDDDYA